MNKAGFLLLFCFICSATIAVGQEQPYAEHYYSSGYPFIETINAYDETGFLQNWNLVRNSQGVIFVGTLGNISAFDGSRWTRTRIPNANVLSLAKGADDTIYAGGLGEFGYIDFSGTIQPMQYISLSDSLPDSIREQLSDVWQILPVGEKIYIRSANYLIQWDGDSLKYWEADNTVRLLINNEGQINLYVEDHGVYGLDENNELKPNERFSAFQDLRVFGIYSLDEQTDVVITNDGGLYRVTGHTTQSIEGEVYDLLMENNVYKTVQLHDGSLVAGTLNAGIIRFTAGGELLAHIDSENGLEEDRVYSLFVDADGALWATHDRHISKINFQIPIRKMDARKGIYGGITGAAHFGDTIFLTSFDGFFSTGNRGNHFDQPYPDMDLCQSVEKMNERVIFYCNQKLYSLIGNDLRHIEDMEGVRFLLASGQKENLLFIGSENGLQILDTTDDSVSGLVPESNYSINSMEELGEDLWFGTLDGHVFRYRVDELQRWHNDNSYDITGNRYVVEEEGAKTNSHIRLFAFQERLLFSSSINIYRFLEAESIFELDNVFGENFNQEPRGVYRLLEDSDGNVWMRSGRQLIVAWKKNDGTYDIRDNLLSRIDDSHLQLIKQIDDGVVWFGGSDGLYEYRYDQMAEYKPDIRASIKQVYLGTDSLIIDMLGKNGIEDLNHTFDYADNQFRFTVSLPSFDDMESNRFQFKLENFDEGWTSWNNETHKDYTNIPEGNYTFQVRGRDVYGNVYDAAGFSFTVLPPWYRTWWAYLLYFISITGLLYIIHVVRVNRLLQIQRIRNRIASDLHDEISATLSSISFFAEAIRRSREPGDKEKRFVELISKSAGEAKESMSDIIWSINPENDDWKALLAKCRRFASDILESREIAYDLDIIEEIPKNIDIELRQHFWLIFKEMVTNAARHSDADCVNIVLDYRDKTIILEVADNGKGIDEKEAKSGNGLKNIRQRAEKIGAHVSLSTGEDGTTWRFTRKI